MSQGKRWCFTLNNYTDNEYNHFIDIPCKYLIIGKEVGENGTPHLQGYIVFETNKRLSAVKRENNRAHWELARGDTASNVTYCSKDGNFLEKGVRPKSRADLALVQHDKWKDVIRSAKEGRAQDEYPREYIQYNSTILRLYEPRLETLNSFSGLWFYGEPGTGKSRKARNDFPGLYDKLINKWWDGYIDQSCVLIDDLGRDHLFMGSFLKRWADHYPFRGEYKGGSKVIRPQTIVVTSNYSIREIFGADDILCRALERRFTSTHFSSLQ